MKFLRHLGILFVTMAVLAGCQKPEEQPLETTTLSIDTNLPTQAQPKLPTIKLWVGAEEINAEMALTSRQEQTGMMFRTNIAETDAMIFPLPYPQRASFWMMNCPESLSAAYIDPDGVIQEIHLLEANNTNSVIAARDNIYYVLEMKEGWFDRHHVTTGMVVRTEKGSMEDTFRKPQR